MSDNSELKYAVKFLRDDAKRHNPHDYADSIQWSAADALEALAGEVERLTSDVDALGDNLEKAIAERDRLKAALETIAEEHDAGRHDGLPEPCPAHDADTMFYVARKALGDAS